MCSPDSIIHKKLLCKTRTKSLSYKMLASTIQFPNNNPITPTTNTTHPQKDASTCRLRPCAGQTRKNKNPTTTHPTQSAKQATARSLLFQDPTVCQKTTHTHEQSPFPEPPGHKFPAARTRRPPTNDGQPQFVDIPPLSTRPSTQVMETSSTEHPPTNHRGSAEMVLVAP